MKNFKLLTLITLIIACSKEEEVINENNVINAQNYEIWNGPLITFEKIDGSDPSQAINQDRITENVWITRGNNGGQIYNIAKENSPDKSESPIGTEWAIGNLDEIETLEFKDFRSTVGKPQDVVGKDLVVHLIDDDFYLAVKFSSWSQGQKGGFSYQRTTQ
tara:strand:+ start:95 stop:577 length:483 start_codon:yes stop_codon:yes gene_type:complete